MLPEPIVVVVEIEKNCETHRIVVLLRIRKKCCVRGDGNHRAEDLQITLVGEGRVAGRILSCGFIGENGAKWKCKRHSSTGQSRWHEVKDKKRIPLATSYSIVFHASFSTSTFQWLIVVVVLFSGWFVVWIWVIYEVILMRLDRIRQRREEERKNVEKKFLDGS